MTMLTRQEAAAMLGVSLTTLDKMRRERRIGYYQARPGCVVKFSPAHIEKYLKRVERDPKDLSRKK